MEHYNLVPDMLKEHLVDLQMGKGKDPFDQISTQTKSSLTRTYNVRHKSSLKKVPKARKVGNLFLYFDHIYLIIS